MSKSKFVGVALATFVAASLTACSGDDDSGYVSETRKAQDYAYETALGMPWDMLERAVKSGNMSLYIPKSYKSEKENTQPPFMMMTSTSSPIGVTAGVFFETKRSNEIQSVKVNGGKCKIELERSFGLSGDIECDAKSVSKIEIETTAGKFAYKF